MGIEKYSQSQIKIMSRGQLNLRYSGPDFLFSCIEFDGLTWFGHIEIHKEASDWYRHKHHRDLNYNSVVLHVVSNDDCVVEVRGRPLPTLVISRQLIEHLKYSSIEANPQSLACSAIVKVKPPIHISDYKVSVFKKRIERKAKELSKFSFMEIMCIGFGGHRNGVQLHQLNFDATKDLSSRADRFGRQNTFDTLQRKFKAFEYIWTSQFGNKMYFEHVGEFYENIEKALKWVKPTPFEYNYIIVNAAWPLILSQYGDIEFIIGRALAHEPESFHLVDKFKDLNLSVNNALDSQAYLEIYKQFCSQKKCLNCQIGKSIFKP